MGWRAATEDDGLSGEQGPSTKRLTWQEIKETMQFNLVTHLKIEGSIPCHLENLSMPQLTHLSISSATTISFETLQK